MSLTIRFKQCNDNNIYIGSLIYLSRPPALWFFIIIVTAWLVPQTFEMSVFNVSHSATKLLFFMLIQMDKGLLCLDSSDEWIEHVGNGKPVKV